MEECSKSKLISMFKHLPDVSKYLMRKEHNQMPCQKPTWIKVFNAWGGKCVTPDSLRTMHFAQVLSHNNVLHTDDTRRQEM